MWRGGGKMLREGKTACRLDWILIFASQIHFSVSQIIGDVETMPHFYSGQDLTNVKKLKQQGFDLAYQMKEQGTGIANQVKEKGMDIANRVKQKGIKMSNKAGEEGMKVAKELQGEGTYIC